MAGILLSLAFTILVAGLFGLMLWETVRLIGNRVPITGLVRYTEAHLQMRWACTAYFVAGGIVGWLVAHFGTF